MKGRILVLSILVMSLIIPIMQEQTFVEKQTAKDFTTGQETNKALYFDGSNMDEVVVQHDSSLNPTEEITIMAWIKAINWDGNRRILEKGTGGGYAFIDEGNMKFDASQNGHADTPLPPANEWVHVTGTFDGSDSEIFYNGQLQVSASTPGDFKTSTEILCIGIKPYTSYPGDQFYGYIDEVRIYTRVLSQEEIESTMDNSNPATDDLVLHFSFDSLDGDTCPDLSPQGNDGTNNGAEHVQSFEWNVTPATPTTPHFTSLPDPVVTPTMLMEWNESTCPDAVIESYTVEIDTSDLFSDPTSHTVFTTSIEVSGLTNGTYYTRVKSTNENGISSSWSDASSFVVTLPKNDLPEVPTPTSDYIPSSTNDVLVTWLECSDPDGSVIEYQLEFDQDNDFIDSTSITTTSTNYTFTDLADGTYFVRIRSVDDLSFMSNWSATVEIFVYTGTLSIFTPSNSTILDSSTNQTIKWTINSNYTFSYEVFKNDELIDENINWTDDVVIEIDDYTPGVYEYTIIITDVLDREFSESVFITIEPDVVLAILTVSTYGGISAVILIGVVAGVIVLSRRKTKSDFEKAMKGKDIVPINELSIAFGKSEQEIRDIVNDTPYVTLSKDGESVVSIQWLRGHVETSLSEKGHLDIRKLSKLSGVSSDKISEIADKLEPALIFTDDLKCYRRDDIIKEINEYLLSKKTTSVSELEQHFKLSSDVLTGLVASSRLVLSRTEDGTIRAVDSIFEDLIKRAQALNILFISDEAERFNIPLEDLINALQYKRFDEIQIITSVDLILSSKWISAFRERLQEDREGTLSSLRRDYNLDDNQIDAITRRYSTPKTSDPITRRPVTRQQELPAKEHHPRPIAPPKYTPRRVSSTTDKSENLDAARGVVAIGILLGVFLNAIIGLIVIIFGSIIYYSELRSGSKTQSNSGGVICPSCWTTSVYHISQQDMFGKVNCPNCGEHFKPDKLVHGPPP